MGGSPYSKWWRWSHVITEPISRPTAGVIPDVGMFDITIIVAYFGCNCSSRVILRAPPDPSQRALTYIAEVER
ncbi:MAG: YggT family protein [Gemmatimonadaceae bacterium]|nr:YggT family protein [Gemmatimonadaceae bacterium]